MTTNEAPRPEKRPAVPPPLPASRAPKSWRRRLVITGLACGLAVAFAVGITTSLRQPVKAGSESPAQGGISHIHDAVESVPWSIHVVKIDRSRKDVTFYTPLARGTVLGVSRISELARDVPANLGKAVAAVNGDFYERDNPVYAGDPRGLQIVDGELVSAPSTVSVWFDREGNPQEGEVKGDFNVTWPDGRKTPYGLNQQRRSNMAVLYTPTYGPSTRVSGGRNFVLEADGTSAWLPLTVGQKYRARVRSVSTNSNAKIEAGTMILSVSPQILSKVPDLEPGAVLEFSTETTPDLKGVKNAISGGPILVNKGTPFSETSPPPGVRGGYSENSKYERHPRSAVGWNSTHLFFITVDGRQPGLSVGMTLAELAKYMVKLGCTEGMNFDGGNSASIWMAGEILNNPCQGEKGVANGLVVVRTSAASK